MGKFQRNKVALGQEKSYTNFNYNPKALCGLKKKKGRRKNQGGKIPGDCGRNKGRNMDRHRRGKQRKKSWTTKET